MQKRQIDWNSLLTPGTRGVVVEGQTDQLILTGFLDTFGDKKYRYVVESTGNVEHVLSELRARPDLRGVIDRDWRSNADVADLQKMHPNLIVLPRIMIDNFGIDPDEIYQLLSSFQQRQVKKEKLYDAIHSHLQEWMTHGALCKMLWDSGAHRFCRGETGYPIQLIDKVVTDEAQIVKALDEWRSHFDSAHVIPAYRNQQAIFGSQTQSEQFRHAVHGKMFFNQVVVPVLNKVLNAKKGGREDWIELLFKKPEYLPPDLQPVLDQIAQ